MKSVELCCLKARRKMSKEKPFPDLFVPRWKDWHGLSTVRLTLGFLGLNLIFAWESNVKSVMLPWHSPSSFRTLDTLE